MKILLVFPGHAVSTLSIALGYSRALQALGHEVWRFRYHTFLSFYKKALDSFEGENPSFARMDGDFMVMASERLAVDIIDANPDVAVIVNGMSVHLRAYELLYKARIPTVTVLTESPYADEVQAMAVNSSAVTGATTNDRYSVESLGRMVETARLTYLPHAYDSFIYGPGQEIDERFISDLFFYGTLWPERAELFTPLMASKGDRDFYVDGIDPSVDMGGQSPFLMPQFDMARHYRGTKIALNHHRTLKGIDLDDLASGPSHISSGGAYSLGPRSFEIAACGAFQLSDDQRPELQEVFGGAVPTYKDADDLLGKVDFFLSHPAERTEMAKESLAAVQPCSYISRAEKILVPFLQEVT